MRSTKPNEQFEWFSELIRQIYEASAEPSRWSETVGAIARAMGGLQAVLFTPFAGPDSGGLMFPWQVEEKDLTLYGTKYIDHDLWAQAGQRKGLFQDGAVLLDEDLVDHEALLASVYYREFLGPMGVGRLCSGIVFGGAPGLPATALSVYRGPDDPFGSKDRELMRLLVPHLSRSLGLMHRLNQARYQLESLHAALNRLSFGIFLLNRDMAVIHTNLAAQAVLARADGLQLDPKRRLTALGTQRSDGVRLEDWLNQVVALPQWQHNNFGASFEAARSAPNTNYDVQCCPLEASDPLSKSEGARHIVFVIDPHRLEMPTLEQLRRQFALTPAEGRVALAMMKGGSYKEVAASLYVSEETIRTQIRAIYAKTRTSDKAGLTRLVLSLSKALI